MKVYVINLKKDIQRRAEITKILSQLSIDFEIYDAVYGKNLSSSQIAEVYDRETTLKTIGKELTLGEIGCALSHLGIYQKMRAEKISRAIIFEDDIVINGNLVNLIAGLETRCSRMAEVILLFESGLYYKKPESSLGDFSIHKSYIAWRAHAYYVTLPAVDQMIKKLRPLHLEADNWNLISRKTGIQVLCTTPSCVGVKQIENNSNLEIERKAMLLKTDQSVLSRVRQIVLAFSKKIRNRFLLLCGVVLRAEVDF